MFFNSSTINRSSNAFARPPKTEAVFSDIPSQLAMILLAGMIITSTVLRLLFANSMGFGVDETYYLAIGRSLSLSYLDHPPLTFWIAHLITAIENVPSPLFARSFFVLLTIPLQLLLYDLCNYLFSRKAGIYAVFIYNITPALGLTDGTWILPDGPLLFFLCCCACLLVRMFLPSSNKEQQFLTHNTRITWALAGVCFGFAALSKYHAPIWLLGVFAYMVSFRYARYWLPKYQPWLAVAIAFVISSPVLIWNFQHDWASFAFQAQRSLPEVSDTHTNFLDFAALSISIFAQSIWLTPWLFVIFWYSIAYALIKRSPQTTFCLFLGLPIVLFFTLLTLSSGSGLPHWQMPGYFFLLPIVGHVLSRINNQQLLLAWLLFATLFFIGVTALFAHHTQYGTLNSLLPNEIKKNDPTLDAYSWQELQEPLNLYLDARPDSVIIASNWIDAVRIDLINGGKHPVLLPFSDPRHFAYRYELHEMKHRNAILVTSTENLHAMFSFIDEFYAEKFFLESVSIRRGEQLVANMEIWYLKRPE